MSLNGSSAQTPVTPGGGMLGADFLELQERDLGTVHDYLCTRERALENR